MKDIQGYEGLYAITSCGKVWSYRNNKFLAIVNRKDGYQAVVLNKNGTQKYFRIHRLVAEAYLPNPDNLPEVNHKDEIKSHNYINNLEWCDRSYNINYGSRTNRASRANRTGHTVYCVELDKVFGAIKIAARELNLDASNIRRCCNGKRKTTGGYHFTFKKEVD